MFELLIIVVILQFMVSLITLVSVIKLDSKIEKLREKICEGKKTDSANAEAEENFQAQTLLSCPMCGSKRLSGLGSNQFIAQRTCLDCKSIFKTDKAH